MYSKNCIYDYIQLNISDVNKETSNTYSYNIPQGAYYDIKRGPVCSISLIDSSISVENVGNLTAKLLIPTFNSYNNLNSGIEIGNYVFEKTSTNHFYRLNSGEPIELLTSPHPNVIRFEILNESGNVITPVNGYLIFKFSYYDQNMIDQNILNEQYKLL